MIPFRSINFGLCAGEEEASQFPNLLEKGFFDSQGIIQQLLDGPKFLVLGYKGSGKSLIGEKVYQIADEKHNWFCQIHRLGDFPFKAFGRILPDRQVENNNHVVAWEGVLLLSLLATLSENQLYINRLDSIEQTCLCELRKAGLLPSENLRQLVSEVTNRRFKVELPHILSAEESRRSDYIWCFNNLITMVKRMLSKLAQEERSFVIIDGLDELLTLNNSQSQILSGLLHASEQLNSYFLKQRKRIKVILLWRTDLFDEMEDSNKNKTRRDSAIVLDWYHDPKAPEDCMLVKLVNLRAKLADPSVDNLFSEHFNEYCGNETVVHYLLDRTRHTPRDFIQLLKEIQAASGEKTGKLDYATIQTGIRNYSKNYLFPEIKDELAKRVLSDSANVVWSALQQNREAEINTERLLEKCERELTATETLKILNAMFTAGAIGNKIEKRNSAARYIFSFRNRSDSYSTEHTTIIHKGLRSAFSIG